MPSKRILIAAPIRPGATSGNSVTAERWANQLGALGHDVVMVAIDESEAQPTVEDCDVLVALHARRCAAAVRVGKLEQPDRPVIVGLAGTDLYRDLPENADTQASLDTADHLVLLQDAGLDHLQQMEPAWRAKASVVHQSVEPSGLQHSPPPNELIVLVLSHLRDVKDPLLPAAAVRDLPADSRLRVVHAGGAHTSDWKQRALDEADSNDRYEWLGEVSAQRSAELLAGSSMLACTSVLEGGANVVSEAIAMGVPVIGTDIGGNRGLLGADHPGLVPVRDVQALTKLLSELEADPDRLEELEQRSIERQWMVDPKHERDQWENLLNSLKPSI